MRRDSYPLLWNSPSWFAFFLSFFLHALYVPNLEQKHWSYPVFQLLSQPCFWLSSFCFFIEPTCCVPAFVISTAKRCVHWPLRTLSNWCVISFPWLKLREPIGIYRTFTSTTGAEVLVKEGQEWHQQQKLLVWKQWLLGVGVASCEPSVWALKSLLCILREGAFKWNGH